MPWLAYGALGLSTSLIGTYVGMSKLLVLVFPIFLLAWLRFGIAAVAMLPWIKRGAFEPPLSRRDRWLLFLESFLGNFLFSICMLFGIRASSALAAGVIMAGIPAAVALMSWGLLGERIPRRVMAAIACAVLGIGLVASSRNASGGPPGSIWGPILLLAAMFCEASYVVIGKQLTAQVSAKRISALINLWGLALVTPLGLWQAMSFDFRAVSGASWAMLLFYALAASVATVWLWMTGLVAVPAASAGVFMVFLPIAAALVGLVLLGEHMNTPQALAYGLALLGVVLATWPARSRAALS